MKKIYSLISMATILFSGCANQKQTADLIVINASVYTVNEGFEIAESFAVKDGKFIALGTNKQIQETYTSEKLIDLEGKAVFPGFYDAHCHFLGYGLGLQEADLVGAKSFEEVIERVRKHAGEKPSEWIIGRGWDQNDWENKELPDNEKLNLVFPDIPVVLTRVDGHALIVNDAALKKAQITLKSKTAGGSYLVKNGKLSGVLVDNAMNDIYKVIPKADNQSKAKALTDAQEKCFAVGLTSVSDAGLNYDEVKLIEELQKSGSLKMRIYAMLSPTSENMKQFVEKGPYKTERLSVRCIKLYADGALGSRGACLIEPYSDDPDNKGLIVEKPEIIKEICQNAYNQNYQVAIHAIGDSANRLVLNLYGEILKGENDRRWRIEHAQVIAKADFDLFKKFTIIPSVQPTHATSDMYWADQRLGAERIKFAYAYKSLKSLNGWIPFGSDFPVEDINPLFGFYSAVSRMDKKFYPNGGFQIQEALSREESLKGMTIWAAKSNFEEKERGSIEPGKFADFVVLEKDIMKIDIKEVPFTKVLQTFSGGLRVF